MSLETKRNQRVEKFRTLFVDVILWVIGSLLYATAINMFTAPNNVLLGGFSGVATMLNYLYDLPIGTLIFIFNIPLFLIAFKKFGYKFIIRTVVATTISSFIIDLTAPFMPEYSGDLLLASLFGGVLAGAGLGMIFLRGATTGGTDIIAKLLRSRYPHLSMGKVILILDLVVIAASFFVYRSIESMLYALIVIFISSQTIDFTISGTSHSKIMFIVTEKSSQSVEQITGVLRRGVTEIPVTGGYTRHDKKMLFCVVRASEVSKFSKAIKEIDPHSFMVISDAGEILGEGFKHIDL